LKSRGFAFRHGNVSASQYGYMSASFFRHHASRLQLVCSTGIYEI
jgi:hypothetical protein